MRIGFITQLLWPRYGEFWRRLLADAGADPVTPDPQAASSALADARVAPVPGISFRLAVAQAIALHDLVDLIVAPSLNAGSESRRGGGQDPWIADFPGALATLAGLPPILGVPAELAPEHESLAVETLHQMTRQPAQIRRLWDRHRSQLRREKLPEPRWTVRPSDSRTVGMVGQPWLLSAELVARAVPEGTYGLSQAAIDPERLREEGRRVDPLLLPTDLEAVGAARLFARRGSVDQVHVIVDSSSGADIWLRDRVARVAGENLVVHEVHELLGEQGATALLH